MFTPYTIWLFKILIHGYGVTLGVFRNNEPAYRCYKAVGFREVMTDEPEYYDIFGERWECIELELNR